MKFALLFLGILIGGAIVLCLAFYVAIRDEGKLSRDEYEGEEPYREDAYYK